MPYLPKSYASEVELEKDSMDPGISILILNSNAQQAATGYSCHEQRSSFEA
jgi:hypothetical protein